MLNGSWQDIGISVKNTLVELPAESFPNLNIDFGPGSLASYLGSDIGFKEDTVWFKPCLEDWEGVPEFHFDPENSWFKKHIELAEKSREQAKGDDFYVDLPDLMENVDLLASLRGAQEMLYDTIDEPEIVKERVDQITALYYEYFDRFYDDYQRQGRWKCLHRFPDLGTRKRPPELQCDFLRHDVSPAGLRDFVQESLREQAKKAECVLYHLDGPDAIKLHGCS